MFFQVDDALPTNGKTRRLVEPALDGDIAGLAALGVWTLTGAGCNVMGGGTDGFVSRADLVRAVLNPEVADRLAGLLVSAGFWHPPGHDCDRCPPVPQGMWLFHDWFAMKYTPAAQAKVNKAKRQELQDPKLVAQVWARDCLDPTDPHVGACRYCGVLVRRKDTRSDRRPHLDHVDPRKAAGIRNVVLACGQCNQRKGNRTPREAGMELMPQPPHSRGRNEIEMSDGESASVPRHAAGPTAPGSSRPVEHTGRGSEARSAGHPIPDPAEGQGGRIPRPPDMGDAAGPTAPGSSRPVRPTAATSGGRPSDDHTGPPPDRQAYQAETSLVPTGNQPGSAVPGGRGPGQGQGQGTGEGVGEGVRSGSPRPAHPAGPARRKRRRRKRRPSSLTSSEPDRDPECLDAGRPPPDVQGPAGGFGSPWHGWRGPRHPVDESLCPTHRLPEPCWKCGREQERSNDDSAAVVSIPIMALEIEVIQ